MSEGAWRDDGEPDFLFKILVIGDMYVGKSNLMTRYTTNSFTGMHKTTIGVEFGIKTIKLDTSTGPKIVKAQIWDTAGQDRFKTLTRKYYSGADGCLLVYSIDNVETFKNTEKWLDELVENADPGVLVLLVGNKCDLNDKRQVPTSEAQKFAQKNGLAFIETSAKDNTNVHEAFEKLIKELFKQRIQALKNPKADPVPEDKTGEVITLKPKDEHTSAPKREEKNCCK
eukprot:TRINITY_DN494_c0_g1_i1.p1 TRINITY_DN494_c0_g1~~TRINITY_DN494_c0_g1_i1.p1  ORF type:complete len:227 (+),score=49.79 TRINITY_DN494_c0_g1_i1:39-719(+)